MNQTIVALFVEIKSYQTKSTNFRSESLNIGPRKFRNYRFQGEQFKWESPSPLINFEIIGIFYYEIFMFENSSHRILALLIVNEYEPTYSHIYICLAFSIWKKAQNKCHRFHINKITIIFLL